MKIFLVAIFIAIFVSLVIISAAFAQGEELTLSLSKDFGSGGFNSDIQGTFTVKASGPANLEWVQFFLDETRLGEDTEAPFAIQFVTDNYPTGAHDFVAVGFTTEASNSAQKRLVQFLSRKNKHQLLDLRWSSQSWRWYLASWQLMPLPI